MNVYDEVLAELNEELKNKINSKEKLIDVIAQAILRADEIRRQKAEEDRQYQENVLERLYPSISAPKKEKTPYEQAIADRVALSEE